MSSFKIPRDIDTVTIDLSEHDRKVRNKAIDECIEIVKFHRDSWDGIEWAIRDIEQLKAGGENDKSI